VLPSRSVAHPFENILIIRPSALGDVARSVPALASLRVAYPHARIDWVIEEGMEGVIESHPALTSAVIFPKRAIKAAAQRLDAKPLLMFRSALRSKNYDAVFDLQGLARSAMMTYATGAPVRVGLADAREFGWLAYTHKSTAPAAMHAVKRMLDIVRAGGVEPFDDIRLYTSETADQWLRTQPWSNARYAVIAPTSRWPAKQWPQERFAQLASWLTQEGLRVVVVGGKSEREQCPAILRTASTDSAIIDCIGATTVAQMMSVIKHSALVVANDSAALHIAVGFSRPLVALFGPTRVERVGPYRRELDVIQHVGPDDDLRHKVASNVRLMERITLQEVTAMCSNRLNHDQEVTQRAAPATQRNAQRET
jgi:heptosyltransferase-1